ncbi:MAG TPA: hypothetical protein VG294_16435 [Solirubrobacteraceae bacterium]|jgi:hypothetical protein|nr:hypothetical protein [Solirubrobacteraceae bacterium]
MPASSRLPRLDRSQPWYLFPLIIPWAVLAIFFWICAGVWIVARFITVHMQRLWRALWTRRAG